jgi:hypothetical protein
VNAWIGLVLGFVSALVVNWAYTREHRAAATLPPLSPRHPLASARLLLDARAWLAGFGAETGGWILYVLALALAPLALVQTVGAAGIVVLAAVTARGPRVLARHERLGVVVAFAGLALLGLSLVGERPVDHAPNGFATAVWLGACVGGALFLASATFRGGRAAPLGLAAGLLFAAGDISAKLVIFGGGWILAAVPLVLAYGLGTLTLQASFQHGDALTGAGLATLTTNTLPIAAGFVLFDESLPGGGAGVMQVAAFACIVLSATAIADPRARDESRREVVTDT